MAKQKEQKSISDEVLENFEEIITETITLFSKGTIKTMKEIERQNFVLSHRENLRWYIQCAGRGLRLCPEIEAQKNAAESNRKALKIYLTHKESRLLAKRQSKHLCRLNINKMDEQELKKELTAAKIILEKIGYSTLDERLQN